MERLSHLALSIFTYLLLGYVAGLIVGFTVFDPNSDIYALLSLILAIVGVLVGIVPFFRRRVYIAFGSVIGFYLGMLLSILLWGDPATDDLLEVMERGGISLVFALVTGVLGGAVGSRVRSPNASLPTLALLLGGFLGGAVFVSLGIGPSSSMVGISPFVLGSGIALALLVWRLQRVLVGKAAGAS